MVIKQLIDEAPANSGSRRLVIIIVNVNKQSLATQTQHTWNDWLLMFADFLPITGTWVNAQLPKTNISNFQLVNQLPCERRAAGVVLYKRNDFVYVIIWVQIELS